MEFHLETEMDGADACSLWLWGRVGPPALVTWLAGGGWSCHIQLAQITLNSAFCLPTFSSQAERQRTTEVPHLSLTPAFPYGRNPRMAKVWLGLR